MYHEKTCDLLLCRLYDRAYGTIPVQFCTGRRGKHVLDKRAVILEKPETLSNREFLGQIDTALGKIGADIMYRYAELDGDKPLYRYYKTSHTDSFLSVSTGKGSVRLESDEFFSTAKQPGAMALHLSSLFQDTAIYPLMQAQQHDLTAATWYVAEGQLDAVLHALKGLGYSVTATNERLLSTKRRFISCSFPPLCFASVSYSTPCPQARKMC